MRAGESEILGLNLKVSSSNGGVVQSKRVESQPGNRPMPQKMDEELRRHRVRQLFIGHPAERTETGVLLFFAWLEKHYPHLLPTAPGDPYQNLKMDLDGLFK